MYVLQLNINDGTLNVDDANLNIDDGTMNVDDANLNVDDGTMNVDDGKMNDEEGRCDDETAPNPFKALVRLENCKRSTFFCIRQKPPNKKFEIKKYNNQQPALIPF
jgi:hypothetical protein